VNHVTRSPCCNARRLLKSLLLILHLLSVATCATTWAWLANSLVSQSRAPSQTLPRDHREWHFQPWGSRPTQNQDAVTPGESSAMEEAWILLVISSIHNRNERLFSHLIVVVSLTRSSKPMIWWGLSFSYYAHLNKMLASVSAGFWNWVMECKCTTNLISAKAVTCR
jgi:hypothetical protein